MKMLLLEKKLSIAPLTIPMGTLLKFHSRHSSISTPTPRGTQVCQAEDLRLFKQASVGLGSCHLEQKNYYFNFDGQIQVGTIDHFIL